MKRYGKIVSLTIVSLILIVALVCVGSLREWSVAVAVERQVKEYNSEIATKLVAYNSASELEENSWYVSDVMVAYGGTLSDAEQAIRNKGYLPYHQNTNEYGAGLATCIGYKLTQDKSKAITSLALMNQHGGYQEFDYESFLEGRVEGLEDIVNGMMTACKTMRENIRNGNEAAKCALQYLNLYHVPGDDADTPSKRTLLGDYLLDEKRTYDDYKKVILVTDASTLTFINGHLGAGCNDSYVAKEQKLFVGGIQNNPTWLRDAFDAVLNNPYLYCIDDDEINDYWLYLMDHCYADTILLVKDLENSAFDEKAIDYLKNIKNEADNGKAKKIAGKMYTDLWDFLSQTSFDYLNSDDNMISKRLLYAFVNALPSGLSTQYFTDIVNLFCEKGDGTLPKYYTKTPAVESKWMVNAMNTLRKDGYNPDNGAWVEKQLNTCVSYRNKIEMFVSMIEDFYNDYYDARIAFGNVCGVYPDEISEEDAEMALEEVHYLIEQGENISDDSLTDDLAVMSAYTQLAQYSIVTENTTLEGYQLPPGYESWEQVGVPGTNDPANLGEYLIMIAEYSGANEKKTLDAKVALASVLYNSMTDAQHYNISSTGLVYFFNFVGYGGDGLEKYKELFEVEGKKFSDAVMEEIGTPTMSIWYGTHEDLLHVDNLYQTNRSLRANAVEEAMKNAMEQKKASEAYSAHLARCADIIGVASLAAGVVSGIACMAAEVSFTGMFTAMGSVVGNLVLSSGSVAAITTSMVGAAFAGFMFVASIVLMVAFIVLLVLSLIPPSDPPVDFTPIPETMVDVNDDNTALVRYDVARDQDGNPSDLNKNSPYSWLALYYSKEASAGSPLMAISENDAGFISKFGDMSVPEKYVPLGKFGEKVAFNLNYDQKETTTGGIYLFYKTFNSENGIVEETSNGKYIYSLKLGISTVKETAKRAVTNESGYSLVDVNLTPNSKEYCDMQYYTYIGYKTTDSASEAIKDIRAAYATDAVQTNFGDALYYNVYPDKTVTCPLQTSADKETDREYTPFYYQLYYSRSSTVGDPILADSLRVIKDLGELRYNEEYARCFSGEAFDPQADMAKMSISGVTILDPEHYFLAYTDEKPDGFDGSKTYLAGLSFFGGTRYTEGWRQNENDLLRREANLLGITLLDRDLTPVDGDVEPWEDNIGQADHTYMGYTTTNNPKKAIYSFGVFVGEKGPYDYRQYPANINNNGFGYGASNIYYIKSRSDQIKVRYNHAYVSTSEDELDYPEYWMGYKTFQRGRAMYQAGATTNPEYSPILLSDVIWTTSASALPCSSGTNSNFTRLTGEKVNEALPTGYRSVHALVEKYHDVYDAVGQLLTPGTNLGFDHPEFNSSLYIYYRSAGKRIERGTYVSKVEIVGDTNGSSISKNDSGYFTNIEQSLIYGLTYGDEIIGLDDPLGIDEKYALHVDDSPIFDGNGGTLPWYEYSIFSDWGTFSYAYSAVYLAVSYSNREADALSTVVISTNYNGAELPNTKQVVIDDEGTKVECTKGSFTCPAGDADYTQYLRGISYTVYSSKNGTTPIGRIAIVRDNEADLDLNGCGFRYLEDENGKIFNPYDAEDPLKRQAVVLIDAYRAEYIESIVAFDDMDTADAWNELMKEGYQEMIVTDALGGLGTGRVHFGMKRTSSSLSAIKDIICSPTDHGETYTYDGREYKRINSFSISNGVPLASQNVYLYATKGNDDDNYGSKPVYLAIRNLGVMVEGENSRVVYWNGDTEMSVLSGSSNKTVIKNEDGESQNVTVLTTTNIEGSLGLLDGGAFEYQKEYLKKYSDEQYEAFLKNSGNAKLVFTNLAGQNVADYQKGYTGSMSILGDNGIAIIVLSSVFVIAVGGVLLYIYKRRKATRKATQQEMNNNQNKSK